ncbi:Emopamil-binding protein [Leucosporidium creatinivorum]|uniref:Emopamil-binding protein n=1 Tax=Leucosporidium creatinivorum TaxID=106004 RepID=A0A1Y2FX11_9BASI|nr:Emopamil-binding protein [Leucosporidium creatinivorum]
MVAAPSPPPPELFTVTTIASLAGVLVILLASLAAAKALLPAESYRDRKARFTFIWLVFDALIHFIFEGSFIFLSFPQPRTVNSSTGIFAELWKEYAIADSRWGVSDPCVVSLELLTVFGAGPLACYIVYQLIRGDPARHYWIVVLSTAEIYGGWMTFVPEWITGSHALRTDNWLHKWLYLAFFNLLWVFIPLWLMYDSFGHIAKALRQEQGAASKKVQ